MPPLHAAPLQVPAKRADASAAEDGALVWDRATARVQVSSGGAFVDVGTGGGGGATNLGYVAGTRTVTSDTGADAVLPLATTAEAGLMAAADKTKLDGIATGATVNATDAALRDRATHTGTQDWSTITGTPATYAPAAHTHPQSEVTNLVSDLAGKAASVHTHPQSDITNLVSDLAGKAATSHTHAVGDIASVATARLLGRTTAGTGVAEALTGTQATALLDAVTSSAKGLAPASGGGTTNFLRADGTWAAPGGGASESYGVLQSDYTLANSAAAQKLFNWSANGALTLATGVYVFDALFRIVGMSATSGNGAFHLLGAGTATLARITQQVVGFDASSTNVAGAASTEMATTQNTANPLVTASTGTALAVRVTGTFDVTAGGTIIPSFALNTAVATAAVQGGSYFRCLRLGATATATSSGWS